MAEHNIPKKEDRNVFPEKRIEKVASGQLVEKKKGGSLIENLFKQEDLKDVVGYVWKNVIFPTGRDLLFDVINTSSEMVIYKGDKRGRRKSKSSSDSSYKPYNRYYGDDDRTKTIEDKRDYDPRYNEVFVSSHDEAVDILEALDDIMATYHFVSVADLCEAAGISSPYTANNYGWKDISKAQIVPTRGGFIVRMPKAYPID